MRSWPPSSISPNEKLPQLKARCADEEELEQWYTTTLLRLIDICRLVSSKHTREHVRKCLPVSCGYILDELLHAHFEDHDKDLYYGQIVGSIIENGRADKFIVRLCELIKRLAVDKLHIVGDLFDRGPRPISFWTCSCATTTSISSGATTMSSGWALRRAAPSASAPC